jgi:hypothetical protein
MADIDDVSIRNVPHVQIEIFQETGDFIYPGRKQERKPIRADYAAHAESLLAQLTAALGPLPTPQNDQRLRVEGLKPGTLVTIETRVPDKDTTGPAAIPRGFEFKAEDVVVLKSTRNERTETAVVFVPDDARPFLSARLKSYGRDAGNEPRPDLSTFEPIETIAGADGANLVTPANPVGTGWWELWVRGDKDRAASLGMAAPTFGLEPHPDQLIFPEVVVLLVHGQPGAVLRFVSSVPGAFVEVRRATDTIEVFLEENRSEGLHPADHVAELVSRVEAPPPGAPAICILDSGVATAHPLLVAGLASAWAYDERWGTDDHIAKGGHGTGLSGLVLFGDLFGAMADQRPLKLTHCVESMKYLTPTGFPQPPAPSYGAITQGAIALAELNGEDRPRSFCIASTTELMPASQPSSWSGALDQLAAGSTEIDRASRIPAIDTPKRLFLVAAGNMIGGARQTVLDRSSIEDPAQSWNALTIGGYTAKDRIEPFELGVEPLVDANDVSPFSPGSNLLSGDLTPIKPEVLFEAGNMAVDMADDCGWHPSLSLLAPRADYHTHPIMPFQATSAAVAVAGNFLGRLKSELPGLWPETYRALTVQSADWTEPMKKRLVGRGVSWRSMSKKERQTILREMGYGVPNLERAVRSAKNDMVLLAQTEIQPFAKSKSGYGATFNEIHFYDLPWPKAALEALDNDIVTMKVTLSYFVEPNLSGRAATRPETYRSCGLRFDLKKRSESITNFKKRYGAVIDGEKAVSIDEDDRWLLGPNAISAGSLHCDLWRGPAIELVGHDALAIFPVTGWWKTHAGQKRMSEKVRYALTISIDARGLSVDLENEISQRVEAKQRDSACPCKWSSYAVVSP